MARKRRAKPTVPIEPVTQLLMADGFDRHRTFTREEICRRFGYDPDSALKPDRAPIRRNSHRFFREQFLKRGLAAWPIGNTFLVTGEALFIWVSANAHRIKDPEENHGKHRD